MNFNLIVKKRLLIIGLIIYCSLANAQGKKISVLANLGISNMQGEERLGYYIGFNPSIALHRSVSLEGQLSVAYLNRQRGWHTSLNTLIGGRLYLNPKAEDLRLYFNILLGGNYNLEEVSDFLIEEFKFGYSTGLFFDVNKFQIGISYDSPKNLLFKFGYIFQSNAVIF